MTVLPKPLFCVVLPDGAVLIGLLPDFGAVLTIEAKQVGSPETGADCYSENEDSLHCSGSPTCKAERETASCSTRILTFYSVDQGGGKRFSFRPNSSRRR